MHLWFLGRDVGIATPTDGGLMLYVAFPGSERATEFKADIEGELRAFVGALPDAPPIAESRLRRAAGRQARPHERVAARPPAMRSRWSATPRWPPTRSAPIGCGWAVQSAEWLAEAVSPALHGERTLPGALRAYRRRHRRELLGHSLMAADAASRARPMAPPQRLLFAAAVHDASPRGASRSFAGARDPPAHAAVAARARSRRARGRAHARPAAAARC